MIHRHPVLAIATRAAAQGWICRLDVGARGLTKWMLYTQVGAASIAFALVGQRDAHGTAPCHRSPIAWTSATQRR